MNGANCAKQHSGYRCVRAGTRMWLHGFRCKQCLTPYVRLRVQCSLRKVTAQKRGRTQYVFGKGSACAHVVCAFRGTRFGVWLTKEITLRLQF